MPASQSKRRRCSREGDGDGGQRRPLPGISAVRDPRRAALDLLPPAPASGARARAGPRRARRARRPRGEQGEVRLQEGQGVPRAARRRREPQEGIADHGGENGLSSAYGSKRFKAHPGSPNEAELPNVLDRSFDGHAPRTHACSDPACVRVAGSRRHVCRSSAPATGRPSAARRAAAGARGSSRPPPRPRGSRSRASRPPAPTAAASSTTPRSTSCREPSASSGRSPPRDAPTTTRWTSRPTRY